MPVSWNSPPKPIGSTSAPSKLAAADHLMVLGRPVRSPTTPARLRFASREALREGALNPRTTCNSLQNNAGRGVNFGRRLGGHFSMPIDNAARDTGRSGYSAQIAVDTKHNLIAEQQVHSKVSDLGLLAETATAAQENLAVDEIDAVADGGTTRLRTLRFAKPPGSRHTFRSPIGNSFRAGPSRASPSRARPCNDRQWFAAQRASIPSRRSQDNSSRNAPHPPHDAPPGDCAAAPHGSTPSKHANSKPTAIPPVYSYQPNVSGLLCSKTPYVR